MSESSRSLPSHPSLEQQKKLAKELIHAWRAGDPEALGRVRRHLPDKKRITLADARFVLAREYGFSSWTDLRSRIAELTAGTGRPAGGSIEAFRRAVGARDAAGLRTLLEQDAGARELIDEPLFSFDSPALVHVAGWGDLAIVDVLLEYGADPNRPSDWWAGGFLPLYNARGAVADRLLAAGAIPDACAAANLDRLDLLRRLLDTDPERVHERGGDGQTPLHFARSRAVVDLLLERGADIDARDVDHRGTPAEWMIGSGPDSRSALARYLVDRGASADVFLCAALGLTDRLEALLAADPSLVDRRTGRGEYGEVPPSSFHIYTWSLGQFLSPIRVATMFGQTDALRALNALATPKDRFVAACARADGAEARALLDRHPGIVGELTPDDQRALPDAAWAGEVAAVALMLELGFDAAAGGQDGGTVLHCAAWRGDFACIEAALRFPAVRAIVDRRDPSHDGTALGWCIHGYHNARRPGGDYVGVAKALIAAGADPGPLPGVALPA